MVRSQSCLVSEIDGGCRLLGLGADRRQVMAPPLLYRIVVGLPGVPQRTLRRETNPTQHRPTTEVACCGISAAHARTGRPASARRTVDIKPLTPAPITTIYCGSPASLATGQREWGGCGPFWAPSSPLRMLRVHLHALRRRLSGRSGVGSQLPGLAARCLERFVARIDLHDLRLLAQGVVDEVAVGVTQPLPVARAVADGSRRATYPRRDVASRRERAVVVDRRLRPGRRRWLRIGAGDTR